jgi:hypothetical protein
MYANLRNMKWHVFQNLSVPTRIFQVWASALSTQTRYYDPWPRLLAPLVLQLKQRKGFIVECSQLLYHNSRVFSTFLAASTLPLLLTHAVLLVVGVCAVFASVDWGCQVPRQHRTNFFINQACLRSILANIIFCKLKDGIYLQMKYEMAEEERI